MGVGVYEPIKKEIGARATFLVLFVNHNFHGFHWRDVNRSSKIRPDGMSPGVEILRLIDKYRICSIGVSHAYGDGQVVGTVFGFAIDLGVDRKVSAAMCEGVA